MVQQRARPEPHFSLIWAPVAEGLLKEARHERMMASPAALRCSRRPWLRRTRSGTSRSTISAGSSRPVTICTSVRARHGGDPDVPGEGRCREQGGGLRRRARRQDRENSDADRGRGSPSAEGAGHALAFPQGVGGLETTRLDIVLDAGPVPGLGRAVGSRIHDGNSPDRLGWKEIVVAATAGAADVSSNGPLRRRERRASRVPAGPAEEPARRDDRERRISRRAQTAGPAADLSTARSLDAPARVSTAPKAASLASSRRRT